MKVKETRKSQSFREWLAMKFVRLAQWIYPESEAVKAFYMQLIVDEMIYGETVVRVNPSWKVGKNRYETKA